MANFGNELIETLKQFFPVFSKVHKEKQSNQYNSSASDSERDSRSKDNEKFVSSKSKEESFISLF